jgi:hypothetical protein
MKVSFEVSLDDELNEPIAEIASTVKEDNRLIRDLS